MNALARQSPTGLLLLNLGTPDAPETPEVRRYLREFLSDPRVVDIHPIARWLLLNLVILPRRPKQSAEAYRKVWTERGSPLLFHSIDLRDALRERLGVAWRVELGMRYGQPSIDSALRSLLGQGIGRLVVAPLFPHQASSSTGSALVETYRIASELVNVPPVEVLAPFYDEPGFIDAFAARGRPVLDALKPDHVLFSFHGLPERQIRASDETGRTCLTTGCCDRMRPENRHCYRAQSYETARLLAAKLDLPEDGWSVSFQSRLGRTPWIQPWTDVVLDELAKKGVKRLAVYCPAFVADCLETLEEIGIRAKEQFLAAGGEALELVPSLNASPEWVEAVVNLVELRRS